MGIMTRAKNLERNSIVNKGISASWKVEKNDGLVICDGPYFGLDFKNPRRSRASDAPVVF
jgi:hypothetical protein